MVSARYVNSGELKGSEDHGWGFRGRMDVESVIGVVDSNMGSSKCDRGRRSKQLKDKGEDTEIIGSEL